MAPGMTLAMVELRSALRNRWLHYYTAAFALFAGLLAFGGLAAAGFGGAAGFGPTAASLISLNLVIVPLMALTVGALAYCRDRERGTLSYLGALPLSVDSIFWAKALGLAVGLSMAVALGFSLALVVMALMGVGGNVGDLAAFVGLTWLLALAMGGIGLAISVNARRVPAALGLAIVTWLLFVLLGDLGIMATAMTTHVGMQGLLWLTILNPVEAYKIAAIAALSGSVDVLGPGGRLATDIFGGALLPVMVGALCAWLAASGGAAWWMARHGDVA